MPNKYGYDLIDGRRVEQLVVADDYELADSHAGTVHVEGGEFVLSGTLNGTLDIQSGVTARIPGTQQGTVSIASGAEVFVSGTVQGTVQVSPQAELVIEPGGKLAGTLSNHGVVVVRGVFGGAENGDGQLRVEGSGAVKRPVIRDGVHYYEW